MERRIEESVREPLPRESQEFSQAERGSAIPEHVQEEPFASGAREADPPVVPEDIVIPPRPELPPHMIAPGVAEADEGRAGPQPKASRRAVWLTAVALSIPLLVAVGALTYFFVSLNEANSRIAEQEQRIDEQEDVIEDQTELIEKKEQFGAAASALMETANSFTDVPFATVVPFEEFEVLAARAWNSRWDAPSLSSLAAEALEKNEELEAFRAAAAIERATNATQTKSEEVLDMLGSGFVSTLLEDADAVCEQDVIACVFSEDPLVVHLDEGDEALPYMTDWIRTGVAYHEFAHVLQFTNPEPTEVALAAFAGDTEVMADCYALTYLDGWSLEHTVWTSPSEYWEVEVGYGAPCDDAQKQAIREWNDKLGFEPRTISP